jgi:hypothetical protein
MVDTKTSDETAAAVLDGSELVRVVQGGNMRKARSGQFMGLSVVRAVATANVALATALENGDSLDGVTLATGDLVLLTAQTAPAENGVYVVPASGAAARHASFAAYDELPGRYFSVMEGTAKADTLWRCTSDRGGTIDTTALAISQFTGGSGKVAQVVNTQTGAVSTTATTIPGDDTIPQNTEGGEFMTLAITPTDAASKLVIEVEVQGAVNAGARSMAAAVFQDTIAGALAAGFHFLPTINTGGRIHLRHVMTAGTTSATTFKVRAGSLDASTFTFNGVNGARIFGGVLASSITITEVLP